MFREIAVVTFTAGMLGTSAATLTNGFSSAPPPPPPAIERPQTSAPVQLDRQKPKRDSDLVAFDGLTQR